MMYYPGMWWCMVSVKLTSCYKKGACFFSFYRASESQGGGETDELCQSVIWQAAAEWKDVENSGVCLDVNH